MSNDEEKIGLMITKKTKAKRRNYNYIKYFCSDFSLIRACYLLLYKSKDAKGQIDDFKVAVEDRNYSEISKLLSTNSQKISETDAKHFVDYINTNNNKRNFEQNIEQTKVNLDKVQHDSEKGEIKR